MFIFLGDFGCRKSIPTPPPISQPKTKIMEPHKVRLMIEQEQLIEKLNKLEWVINSTLFETFDDNFNNHEYEQSMSYTERLDQLVNLLDSIYSNIEEIYFSNLPELKHNQQYAFSDSFRERILQPLRDRDLI